MDVNAETPPTILITGSSGRLGTMLRQRLGAYGWSLALLDRVPLPEWPGAAGTTGSAELLSPANGASVAEGPTAAMASSGPTDDGAHFIGDAGDATFLDEVLAATRPTAIVHLAGQPTEAPWETIRTANLDGVFQLFEAARRHAVPRVVYASSNHAVGFTPVPAAAAELAADAPARPDTLYGVSKIFGEALGRYYVDRYALTVSCLRIGTCDWTPPDHRALSTWLSPDDLTRLVDSALRTNVAYSVVWGISANTRRRWSLDAGHAIGYHPVDDAERFLEGLSNVSNFAPLASDDYVGGGFTSVGFGIDEVRSRA